MNPEKFQPNDEKLLLQDMYIDRNKATQLTNSEGEPDETFCGSVFQPSFQNNTLTVRNTNYFIPQSNREQYERTKIQSSSDGSELSQNISRFNLSAGHEPDVELILPETRVAVGSIFLSFDPNTQQFLIVTRVNDDYKHNPLAGCRTGNFSILETEKGLAHPGAIRMSTYGDIIPFRAGAEGNEYDWVFPDNAPSASYADYKAHLIETNRANQNNGRLLVANNPHKSIILPGSISLDIDLGDGKKRVENGYTPCIGPNGTIELGKLAYIGALGSDISGFEDGHYQGYIVAEPVDDIMENLDRLMQTGTSLTAQEQLDPTQQIYESSARTKVFAPNGKELSSITGPESDFLNKIYSANVYGMLKAMHGLRNQGLSLNDYFKNTLHKDYGVNL
ncbi:MAG: hypothetical protein WCO23_03515 [bacterium]